MIVADTHIIIWDALEPDKISAKAKTAFRKANKKDGIIISDISLWEIAMLINKNRLKIDADYETFIDCVLASNNYIVQSITPEIANLSTHCIKMQNHDPADRIIAATTFFCNASLITADKKLLAEKSLKTIW